MPTKIYEISTLANDNLAIDFYPSEYGACASIVLSPKDAKLVSDTYLINQMVRDIKNFMNDNDRYDEFELTDDEIRVIAENFIYQQEQGRDLLGDMPADELDDIIDEIISEREI